MGLKEFPALILLSFFCYIIAVIIDEPIILGQPNLDPAIFM